MRTKEQRRAAALKGWATRRRRAAERASSAPAEPIVVDMKACRLESQAKVGCPARLGYTSTSSGGTGRGGAGRIGSDRQNPVETQGNRRHSWRTDREHGCSVGRQVETRCRLVQSPDDP